MSHVRPLRGGCACGRNTYIIEVPPNATEIGQVFFDRSSNHSRSQASPLSAWLRVPLSWYRSTTVAFFDDETHSTIRRTYTSPREQNAKQYFCGYCGTSLSYWSESPPSEADYISLTLGSLSGSDLRDLDELGLLPKDAVEEITAEEKDPEPPSSPTSISAAIDENTPVQVVPWFETMIQGSNLGRVKRSRGVGQSGDGRVRVEWEIIELMPDEDTESDTKATSKRKLGDVEPSDSVMSEGP